MAQISDLYPLVRPYAVGAPEPTLYDACIRAAREFCAMTKFVRESFQIDAVANTETYELAPSDPGNVEIVGIKFADYKGISLDPCSPDEVPDIAGVPLFFYWQPASTVGFTPTVQSADTDAFAVCVWTQPKTGSLLIDDAVMRQHDWSVAAGALHYLYAMPKQAWSDLNLAAVQRAIFTERINSARSQADRSARPYRFRTKVVKV